MNTTQQLEPRPPRRMCTAEALVLFVMDIDSPPVDDDQFQAAFNSAASGLPGNVLFGTWKVLRVPDIAPEGDIEKMRLPGQLVDEMRSWAAVQTRPLKLKKIIKYREMHAYAFVMWVPK